MSLKALTSLNNREIKHILIVITSLTEILFDTIFRTIGRTKKRWENLVYDTKKLNVLWSKLRSQKLKNS